MALWPLFSLKTRGHLKYNRAGETNVRTFFLLSVKHVILKTWASICTREANHLPLIFSKAAPAAGILLTAPGRPKLNNHPLIFPSYPPFFMMQKGNRQLHEGCSETFPSLHPPPPTVHKKKKKAERAWLGYRSHVEQGWIDNPADAAWSPRTAETRIGQNRNDRCRPPSHACPYFSPATELEHNSNIDIQGCEIYSLPRPWIMERGYTVKLDEDELFLLTFSPLDVLFNRQWDFSSCRVPFFFLKLHIFNSLCLHLFLWFKKN